MRGRGAPAGRREVATFSRLFARVGVWLAALAILSQVWAYSAAPMSPPASASQDARETLRELTALVGDGVVLCVQVDPKSPTPPPCDDKCPLCQAAHGGFAFTLPTLAVLESPRRWNAAPLLARSGPPAPVLFLSAAQARGPPSQARFPSPA